MIVAEREIALALARAEVRGLPLYDPDASPCVVDVSDNVNLWGSPPAALRALTHRRAAPPAGSPTG